MMGFVKKDFFVMKKQLTYYLLFFAVYGMLGVTGVMPFGAVLGALVGVVGLMCPISTFAYDEQTRWDRFAAATPAGRRGMTRGKYVFALLVLALAAAVVLLLSAVLALTGMAEESLEELVFTVLACVGVSVLMNSVYLPMMFQFGAEKSRIMGIVTFLIVFGGVVLLSKLSKGGFSLPALSPTAARLLPAVALVLIVLGFWVSYRVSLAIMEKKEL